MTADLDRRAAAAASPPAITTSRQLARHVERDEAALSMPMGDAPVI
jgi:hypothetical protein